MKNRSSVVDVKLALYGMRWELNPYRIVDDKTDEVLFAGPHFDLRDNTLQNKRKAFDNLQLKRFSGRQNLSEGI